VQQNPWIQNMSIKDNILFGKPFNQPKYEETLRICQLDLDLASLPAGDETEIGEKGINLSGGQKARVSLARAVYSEKPIVLMDDPISALDSNIKKKVFKHVFMDKMQGKTRVLVTHAVDYLHLCDRIIVMKDGKIAIQGTYQEIMHTKYIKEIMLIHN
jgi:ABC-type bacteriocin/lantibiotic exporter with double-glycine peptidase domain